MCEPHCLSLAATSSRQLAHVQMWRHPQNRKCATHHYAARGGPSHGHRKHAQKIGEDRTCGSGDMIADKHAQTDRQTDTLITILRAPLASNECLHDKLAIRIQCLLCISHNASRYSLRGNGHFPLDIPPAVRSYSAFNFGQCGHFFSRLFVGLHSPDAKCWLYLYSLNTTCIQTRIHSILDTFLFFTL